MVEASVEIRALFVPIRSPLAVFNQLRDGVNSELLL